jgi:hypothetical protein
MNEELSLTLATYVHESAWGLAVGLDTYIGRGYNPGWLMAYTNKTAVALLRQCMLESSFVSLSGLVRFGDTGERDSELAVMQRRSGEMMHVGDISFNVSESSDSSLRLAWNAQLVWPDGVIDGDDILTIVCYLPVRVCVRVCGRVNLKCLFVCFDVCLTMRPCVLLQYTNTVNGADAHPALIRRIVDEIRTNFDLVRVVDESCGCVCVG